MTAAEHIAEAERLLGLVTGADPTAVSSNLAVLVLMSIGHALIANAIENGVPHQAVYPSAVPGV